MSLFRKYILLIVILIIQLEGNAKELYVSPSGNDADIGSLELPWQSINKANKELQPGDILYLREGRYNNAIQPLNNGVEGSPIIYTNYPGERPVIHSLPTGANLSGKEYIVINHIHFENCNYFIRSYPNGFKYSIIKDCTMKDQTGWCGIEIGDGCDFNRIYNNYINSSGVEGDCIHIGMDAVGEEFGAHYNLITNNECTGALHGGICCAGDKTTYNIIRNNYVHNIGDNNIATGALTSYVLIEGNRLHNPGIDADGASAIQLRSENSIIRKNIMTRNIDLDIDNTAGALELQVTDNRPYNRNNKIYHNVIYNFNQNGSIWYGIKLSVYTDKVQFGPNIFKNNIIYKNGSLFNNGCQIAYTRNITDNPVDVFDGNLISNGINSEQVIYFFEYNKLYLSLKNAMNSHPDIFLNKNIDTDPLFVNEEIYDFQLKESSPCIDTGTALTTCLTAGSGYQIFVEDASYFCDGWHLIEGDIIQVGNNHQVKLVSVDYLNNILTINQSIVWRQNDPVSLSFKGKAPDIGAFEFNGNSDLTAPSPPVGIKVINP